MSHDHSQNHYGPNASFDGYDSDLASAGILIESLRQQLAEKASESDRRLDLMNTMDAQLEASIGREAAAIAACKEKDEALEAWGSMKTTDWLRLAAKALAIQPGDSAIKAWIGEPVAWLHENRPEADVITDAVKNVWTGVVVGKDSVYSIPLYSPKGLK